MSDDTTTRGTTDDLGTLVGDWLDWAACAKHLGVPVSKVRTWIREHQLAAAVPAEGAGQQVPALLVMDGVVVKGVPGVLTVLHDGGYDDRAALDLAVHRGRVAARPPDRRAAREPRRRGQAARPGARVLSSLRPLTSALPDARLAVSRDEGETTR